MLLELTVVYLEYFIVIFFIGTNIGMNTREFRT